jgi:exonuclease III
MHKKIHIVCVYKAHSSSIFTFLNNLQTIIQQSFEHCPIIIMGDFNVGILKNNNQAKKKKQELLYFMNKFQLKSQFSETTTKAGPQLDHIWVNVFENECKYDVTKAY